LQDPVFTTLGKRQFVEKEMFARVKRLLSEADYRDQQASTNGVNLLSHRKSYCKL